MLDEGGATRPSQINGWKEIGAFFGKSSRTVQRWEAELGLPVHRLKGAAGEIIYALVDELVDWRDQRSRHLVLERDQDDHEPGVVDTSAPTPEAPPRLPTQRRLLLATAALAVVLAAIGAWTWFPKPQQPVMTAEVSGNRLVARSAAGQELWSHLFDRPLWSHPTSVRDSDVGFHPGDPPRVVDLDRDGRPEVLVIATYGDLSAKHQAEELLCFSPDGRILWRYQPEFAFTFAGRRFEGEWNFLDYLVSEGAREPAVWVSLYSHNWWPSVIVRIDVRGQPVVRFVHAGCLYHLAETTSSEGWQLLAGGVNNEQQAAALAILDEDGPPARSPEQRPSLYSCDDCPSGAPRAYFVFPRTDVQLAEAVKPYNFVAAIRPGPAGAEVLTAESQRHKLYAHYHLTPSLLFDRVTLSDSPAHQLLEGLGRLDHTEADCPARRTGLEVKSWIPRSGWTSQSVPAG